MLTIHRFATVTAVIALTALSCNRPDSTFKTGGAGTMLRPVSDADIAKAREERPPKILPETHFAAGKLFEEQGVFDKAVAQYRKAIALNHNYVEAYHRLGLLYSRLGERGAALTCLKKAVELSPKVATIRNNYGFEFLLNGEWTMAEGEFREAVRLKPDFNRAYVNLGITQSKLGRFDAALASFRTVLPETDAYYNMGLMYRSQKMNAEATGAFEHALALNPAFSAAKTQLSQLNAPGHAGKDTAPQAQTVADKVFVEPTAVPMSSPTSVTIPSDIRTGEPRAPMPPKSRRSSDSASSQASWEDVFALWDEALEAGCDTRSSAGASRKSPDIREVIQTLDGLKARTGTTPGRKAAHLETPSPRVIDGVQAFARASMAAADRSLFVGDGPGVCDAAIETGVSPGPVDYSDEWLGVSPGDVPWSRRIVRASFPAGVRPQGFEQPDPYEVSSLNTPLLLAELETRLDILRNEIDCLDELEIAPPASSSRDRKAESSKFKARLASDPIEPTTRPNAIHAPGRDQKNQALPSKSNKIKPAKSGEETKSPTASRTNWREDFRELEDVVDAALNEFRCAKEKS